MFRNWLFNSNRKVNDSTIQLQVIAVSIGYIFFKITNFRYTIPNLEYNFDWVLKVMSFKGGESDNIVYLTGLGVILCSIFIFLVVPLNYIFYYVLSRISYGNIHKEHKFTDISILTDFYALVKTGMSNYELQPVAEMTEEDYIAYTNRRYLYRNSMLFLVFVRFCSVLPLIKNGLIVTDTPMVILLSTLLFPSLIRIYLNANKGKD